MFFLVTSKNEEDLIKNKGTRVETAFHFMHNKLSDCVAWVRSSTSDRKFHYLE